MLYIKIKIILVRLYILNWACNQQGVIYQPTVENKNGEKQTYIGFAAIDRIWRCRIQTILPHYLHILAQVCGVPVDQCSGGRLSTMLVATKMSLFFSIIFFSIFEWINLANLGRSNQGNITKFIRQRWSDQIYHIKLIRSGKWDPIDYFH